VDELSFTNVWFAVMSIAQQRACVHKNMLQ